MSALGWILFGACNVVCGLIGWQVKGYIAEWREWREDEWARYEPDWKCAAHGAERCERCHLNPSTCEQAGVTPGCGLYAGTGMHWDTCSNRIR